MYRVDHNYKAAENRDAKVKCKFVKITCKDAQVNVALQLPLECTVLFWLTITDQATCYCHID